MVVLAADMTFDLFENLLVAVKLIGTHVNHKAARVGHYIVLAAGFNHRYAHLDRAQQGRHLGERTAAEPFDVGQGSG